MTKIKVIQYGVCHEHASGKIATLKNLPDIFDIAGVVDDRDTGAARFAGENMKPYEGLRLLSRDEAFSIPGLEAVVVEVPNEELVGVGKLCAAHNLPMHLDKPAGQSLAPYGELLDECKAKGLALQMGYMYRGNPAFKFCLDAVKKGWIGDVFEIRMSMSHNYGGEPYQDYLAKFDGGIMYNLGCHLIDFVAAMMGRPVKVTPFLGSAPGSPETCRNNCAAILQYSHAIVYLHACSREVGNTNSRRMKICGTKGTLDICPVEIFNGSNLVLNILLKEGNEQYSGGEHNIDFGVRIDRYKEQLEEFAEIIRGRMTNPYTYAHDYLVHEITLAAAGYITM